MASGPDSDVQLPTPPDWLLRWWWLPVPVICALAWRDSAGYDLVGDARFLITENTHLDDLGLLWSSVTHDYFHSASGNTIPYWRPFTKLSWHLEAAVFGRDAAGAFHIVQILWHLVATLGVMFLARRLGLDRRWSACAGFMYALHPAMVEPTCLVMARSDVTAGAGVVWAVGTFLAWHQTGHKRWIAAHALAVLVALGSKEVGIIAAPLLFLFALAGPNRKAALVRTLPAFALVAIYWLARSSVLDGAAAEIAFHRRRFGVSAGLYLSGLLPLRLDTGVHSVSWLEAVDRDTLRIVGTGWIVTLAIFGFALWKRRWNIAVLLCWIGASLLPVLLVADLNVPGVTEKFPLSERWMVQAVAASTIALLLLASMIPKTEVVMGLQVMVLAWAGVAVSKAPESHHYYASEDGLLALEQKRYEETLEDFRTEEDDCRAADRAFATLYAEEQWTEIAARSPEHLRRCKASSARLLNQLVALTELKRWDQARAAGERLIARGDADTRDLPLAMALTGRAWLQLGQPNRALMRLHRAVRLGQPGCSIHLDIAKASEALQDAHGTAAGLEAAWTCAKSRGERPDPGLLITAAYFWLNAGESARAAPLLREAEALDLPPEFRTRLDSLKRRR